MISKLPPELESKRLLVAKRHNLLAGGWGLFLLGMPTIFLFLVNSRQRLAHAVPTKVVAIGFVIEFVLLFAGLFRILKYEERLCAEIGFVCPHCGKPLYVARDMGLLDGICPKCHNSLLPADSKRSSSYVIDKQ